jgi:type IV secretory pathway VirB10-like protein
MTTPRLHIALPALALTLALSACDGGETSKKTETKVVTKTETKTTVESKSSTKPDPAVTTPDPKAEPTAPAADSPQGKVQLAASVAKEISVAPEQADEILGKHGLDRDKFDALIFEIAGDPELTKAYMAARRTS